MDVGSEVRMNRALNCWPWVWSLAHSPEAVIHSPGDMAAAWPTTVTRSRCPRALMRRTQKPFSALWKVTRSTRPASTSWVVGSGCRFMRSVASSALPQRAPIPRHIEIARSYICLGLSRPSRVERDYNGAHIGVVTKAVILGSSVPRIFSTLFAVSSNASRVGFRIEIIGGCGLSAPGKRATNWPKLSQYRMLGNVANGQGKTLAYPLSLHERRHYLGPMEINSQPADPRKFTQLEARIPRKTAPSPSLLDCKIIARFEVALGQEVAPPLKWQAL